MPSVRWILYAVVGSFFATLFESLFGHKTPSSPNVTRLGKLTTTEGALESLLNLLVQHPTLLGYGIFDHFHFHTNEKSDRRNKKPKEARMMYSKT